MFSTGKFRLLITLIVFKDSEIIIIFSCKGSFLAFRGIFRSLQRLTSQFGVTNDNPQERIEYPQHKPSDYPQEKDKFPQHKLRSDSQNVESPRKTINSKLRLVRELVEINLKYQTRLLKSQVAPGCQIIGRSVFEVQFCKNYTSEFMQQVEL